MSTSKVPPVIFAVSSAASYSPAPGVQFIVQHEFMSEHTHLQRDGVTDISLNNMQVLVLDGDQSFGRWVTGECNDGIAPSQQLLDELELQYNVNVKSAGGQSGLPQE